MKAKLMNGTYYEITGGMSEDIIKNVTETDMSDRDAKTEAVNTERIAYKNTYIEGKRVKSVKLYDPYNDEYYAVGREDLFYEPLPYELRYKYSMLDRLRMDCEYFLGNGNGYAGHLWAGSVEEQIKEMRDIWKGLEDDEKPEWLTMDMIDEYERKMRLAEN